MTEKETLILLNKVDGLGPRTIRSIHESFSKIQDVFGTNSQDLESRLEIKSNVAKNILKAPQEIDLNKELSFIQKENIKIVSLWDENYPQLLAQIYDPAPLLYCKGETNFKQSSIAMVGARSSTHYGNETAFKLAFQLVSSGLTVTSGLARGIDVHAHRGALAGKGRTIGVMGCGFGHFYPAENRVLADQMVLEGGCLISEFSSEVPPIAKNFPRRNRIISGLSLGVVVVEAAQKSGSLITADFALEQGRTVFAVPGRIDAPSSTGTLRLIKDGARLVQGVEDVLEELGLEYEEAMASTKTLNQALEADEKAILQSIGNEPLSVDQVSRSAKFEMSKVLSLLFQLELKKQVKQLPGKYYVRVNL